MDQTGDTLRLRGLKELGAEHADEIKQTVLAALGGGIRFVESDMSGLRFIDSCGLGVLIALNRNCRARNGRLRLLNPSPNLEQVLRLTHLTRVFEVNNETPAQEHDDVPRSSAGCALPVSPTGGSPVTRPIVTQPES